MLIDGVFSPVGIGHRFVRELKISRLFHILHHRGYQPQRIVRAGVLQPVHDLFSVRCRDHGGGAEGLLFLLRLKPARLKEMQAVALRSQGPQQLHQPAAAFFRVGMGDHHGVLRRVPVSKPDSAAHLDKRGKAGEHHIDLALVQVPDVDLGIHSLIGGGDLQAAQLAVPEFRQAGKVLVRPCLRIFLPHGFSCPDASLSQQEEQPCLLSGSKGHGFLQAAAVVAALFKTACRLPRFHNKGIALRAVRTEEAVPEAVKTVRHKIRGKELIAVLFIIKVVLDHPVLIPAARRIQAHLKVPVVHIHMMEAELQIRKDRQFPLPPAVVSQLQVPDLHRVVHGDKKRLARVDAAVVAAVVHVAQAVPAGEMLLRLAHRLPGDAPVISALLIPQIKIVAGAVHRHAVRPEAGDPVVFRAFIDQISPRRVVKNAHHVSRSDIVGPGYGQIHPVDHIFSPCIVKMAVLHCAVPPAESSVCIIPDSSLFRKV